MGEAFRNLLKRVKSAKGCDLSLDADLECVFPRDYAIECRPGSRPGTVISYYESGTHGTWGANPYTSDIGKALRLVERVFPGTLRCVGTMEDGPFCQLIVPNPDGSFVNGGFDATAKTEPLAVLAALLSAAIARRPKP